MANEQVTVLGDGAMASVCALLLQENGCNVTLWCPHAEHAEALRATRRNDRYLVGFELPEPMRFTGDPVEAVDGATLIVSAIPTQHLRGVWQRFEPIAPAGVPIVSVTKGVENQTLRLPTQIIEDILGPKAGPRLALSGPTIARELAERRPASVCIAGEDGPLLESMQTLFTAPWLRVYTNTDLLGVELAGATKNVIALAAGILDGLEAGFNAKSALLARGLSEITRLGTAMGAQTETFFGITGVGDLATTCFCPEGRNRSAGELIGRGHSLDETTQKIAGVIEGVPTAKSVKRLAAQRGVEMPIVEAVHAVLFEGVKPQDAIEQLMSRTPKAERVG